MARRRYLFFDIDGTLTTDSYGTASVPESARRALERLREAGHFLSIATGRSQAMAVDYMRELGFENMVSDGGYGITIDGELVGIEPLDRDKAIALVRECEEKGFPWAIQPDNSVLRTVPDKRFMEFTHDRYMQFREVPGIDPADCEQIYKVYIACYEGEEQQLETLPALPWARFHKEYLFVEPTDKARGVRAVLDHFGAPHADAIVFGDAMNDLSMFVDDWTCVAMGNACPELKERADLVTTDVDRDGIWNACEALSLFDKVDE